MNETNASDMRQATTQRPAVGAAALAAAMMRVLDEIDYALVLVAGDGTLRYANQLGLHELTSGGALQLTHGLVRTRQASELSTLQHAVGDAVRGRRRLMTLGLAGSTVPMALVPVPGETAGEATLALLVFGKRPAAETLSLDFYARCHGLTGAETQVLKGICSGLKPKEVAHRGDVAISTVRSHICSIRMKTQTTSIRDLINRVASLPPITPAMKAMLPAAFDGSAARTMQSALAAC